MPSHGAGHYVADFFLWVTSGTAWMLLFVALLLLVCIAGPFWWTWQNKREGDQFRNTKIDQCRAAIERDPNNASAYVFLGDALMEEKSYVAAAAQYERALSLAPDNRK